MLEPARLDGLADQRFLVRARADFHVIKGNAAWLSVKATGFQEVAKYNACWQGTIQAGFRHRCGNEERIAGGASSAGCDPDWCR